jgi:hypothetical protein
VIGYIIREIAGWALILVGLYFFYLSYTMLVPSPVRVSSLPAGEERERLEAQGQQYYRPPVRILSGPPVALIGFVIFRGGIHLLKVAVAARTSLQARRDLVEVSRRARLPQTRKLDKVTRSV